MSFFRTPTTTMALTLPLTILQSQQAVSGQQQPITHKPVSRDLPIRCLSKKKQWLIVPVCQADCVTSIHASCLTTVACPIFVCVCSVRVGVRMCERDCERVCCVCYTWHLVLLCKGNDQMSLFMFLNLICVPATTLIHSDIDRYCLILLLFITEWLLTMLLYALYKERTLTPSSPSGLRAVNSLSIHWIQELFLLLLIQILFFFLIKSVPMSGLWLNEWEWLFSVVTFFQCPRYISWIESDLTSSMALKPDPSPSLLF